MISGFMVVDKPPAVTSHDIVAMVRAVTGVEKVGHTGTLDPFATGVLPLALGAATRFIRFLDENLKVYDATVKLGASTTTGDPEGSVLREAPIPSLEGVDALLKTFIGERMQTPPAYSAVKVEGVPLYKYARRGEVKEVAARPIRIFDMRLVDTGPDWLRVEIHCTRGTYARVLADDIAVALGSAGHLSALRRLQSGLFTLENSLTLPALAEAVAGTDDWMRALRGGKHQRKEERVQWRPRADVAAALAPRVVTLETALKHIPAVEVGISAGEVQRLGERLPPRLDTLADNERRLVFAGGVLVGVAERLAGVTKLVRVSG